MERIWLAVDLENVGAVARQEGRIPSFLDEFVSKVQLVGEGGLLLGGISVCDHHFQRASAFRLADLNVRVHARPSDDENSADLEIASFVERRPASTDTVVLASGDHIFVDIVARLRAAGLTVVLMAVPGRVSADLYRAANTYIPLDTAA